MPLKRIVILGSTGSIGINTLKVVARYPKQFQVVGISAYNNIELLKQQIKEFKPEFVAVGSKGFEELKRDVRVNKIKILDVNKDLSDLVSLKIIDVVVIAMRGSAALAPFLAAVRARKIVAPANKEALVIAGDIIMKEASRSKATIIPIDSEQSAIFQCLHGQRRDELKKVILTASGGALLRTPISKFPKLSVAQILNHPRWKMGKKITVDSALLMNKGFEVIEAKHLFGLDIKDIEVLIHPQAIIHSMVEFKDGSILAQLGITDMRIPISYALTYPQRMETGLESLDFIKLKQLTFEKPDYKKFPSLSLAILVGKKGGTLPAVLNAADEEAVDAFLNHRIRFDEIYPMVEQVVHKHKNNLRPNLQSILDADDWARIQTRKLIEK